MSTESTVSPALIEGRIKFILSEEGRRDSLRRGGDGQRLQEMRGVVADADLDALAVDDQGRVQFDAAMDFYPFDDEPEFELPSGKAHWVKNPGAAIFHVEWDVVPSWEDLLGIPRELKNMHDESAALRAKDAEKEARIAKDFLEDPSARASRIERDYVIVEGRRFRALHEVAVAARERWGADQEELKKANRATLAEWVGQHGTENQRQRLAAGLLPWKEAHETAEKFLFAPLDEFPLYARFEVDQICMCPSRCDAFPSTCTPKFQSVDATELTAEQWEQFGKIKAAVPRATFQLREHSAQCVSRSDPEIKRGVIVKIAMGQLTFKREYAL